MLNKRAHILFEENTFTQLLSLAKKKDTSVGQLVRSAVEKVYTQPKAKQLTKRKQRHQMLLAWQKQIGKSKKIDYKALIEYGRTR